MIPICTLLLNASLSFAGPAQAQTDTSVRSLLEQAVAAAGGESWFNPSTL